ncbi:MAG TPA: PilC/PilY family type IV pilus protein, partial [Pseudomonadales bacterium]|nr:PilC/PilY family type IV pilus protein [Pseudomonadales bacterium]
ASMTRIDLIRTVLYGGKRKVDPNTSSGAVLLERELIPPDIHAFAKVYDGAASGAIALADLVEGSPTNGAITLCNVSQWPASTNLSGTLNTTSYPPLLRVAYGNVAAGKVGYPNWASTEVAQCQWHGTTHRDSALAQPDRPVGNDTSNAYQVLVERCVAGQDGPLSARCKRYDNGTPNNASDDLFKPIGLLQRYGERGQMRFGLMTGSYDNNSHGGVLRQGVGLLSEVNVATGQITAGSLIGTLDKLRIATYQMDFSTSSLLRYPPCNSYVSSAAVKDGSCADWGNPLGELYLEAVRYLAGASAASAAFTSSPSPSRYSPAPTEAAMIPGLTRLTSWSDPYNFGPGNSAVPCAQCAVLLISTSQGSFDSMRDAADWPSSGLPTGFAVATATNAVQNKEGLDGASVLAGRVGSSTDQECSPKTLAAGTLDQADGICPEAPSAEGGYGIAGLAYEAAIKDLRTGLNGTQKIKTFAVSVAEDLPSFTVTSGTKQAQIVPLCRSEYSANGNAPYLLQKCSLIDVVSEPPPAPATLPSPCTNNGSYHRFLLTWEGTAWGSDYDFDAEQRLEYCEVNGTLHVRTVVTRDQADAAFDMGFTLVGTDPQQPMNYPKEITVAQGSNGGGTASGFQNLSITGGGTTLQKPLWLAAKYGGFNDLDSSNSPNDPREWDSVNNLTGAAGSDGVPDNYFQLRSPSSLEAALNRIFASVAGSVASGTAAAVVANNVSGEGAVYQALYHPRIEAGQNSITWAGTLHGLFIDGQGRLREDFGGNSPTTGNATLDGCDVDPVVEIFFDSVNLPTGTKIRRYSGVTADCSNIKIVTPTVRPLTDLKTLWNARDELARAANHAPLMPQRNYADIASNGRAIYTRDPAATDGTLSDFTSTALASRFRELNPDTSSANPQGEATDIINFIRGQEIAGYRSRTIDYDGNGAKPWLLGDIINSSPVVVGAPNAGHDLRLGDSSYAAFKAKYAKRRQVVYVGANDGMVHAFNGGFWDEANKQFATTANNGETSHPLGAELWAYVPQNLLPHLRWLTAPNYEHIFYVDGTAQSFDVQAFTADSDHPGGWGTILVIGMRFGGVPIDIDDDGDGNTPDRSYRSAYLVLDITNPEQPPKLVAELSDGQLGFTTALPALVRRPNNGWELLFGSGPTASTPLASADAVSSQNAQLYRYDLVNKAFVTGFAPLDLGSTAVASFVGDPLAQDWDGDGNTDEIYFGLVGGTAGSQSGGLYRADPDLGSVTQVIGTRPIIAAPMAVRDNAGKKWLYAGEGKLLAASDRNETGQNSFYGVLLDSSNTALLRTDQIQVANTGLLIDSSGTATPLVDGTVTINDFNTLKNHISTNKKGWVYQLAAPAPDPSARVINPATRAGSTLFFTDFLPPTGSSCDFGQSRLYGLDYQSGTAAPQAAFGDTQTPNNALRLTLPYLSLGSGLSSKPVVYIGEG